MKKTTKFLTLSVISLLLFSAVLVSCKKDNGGGNVPAPVTAEDLNGSITGVKTLDAVITYTITGPVIVQSGATLNIPAGTMIKAKKGFNNYILVLQGGKINVNGTAENPVTMTADIDNAQAGHWGGLIINGKAPLSGGTIGSTEISSEHEYGGNVANDNSGSITYLIIAYSGARSSADVEHNGLTLNGVGNGTKIENIYIINGADDGVEFFGGTVNVKNLLVVNPDDDMFDFTQGYTGTLENAYGIWEAGYTSSESDPRGIEADGNLDGNFPEQSGQSDFVVKNVTFDLRLAPAADDDVTNVTNKMQDVIKMRRGAKATITNALVKGTGTAIDLIDFTDGKGTGDAASSISLTSSLTPAQILGKNVNPETGFAGAKIEDGNTGCATTIFAWTKYKF
ncbi:MAG: hypothetical protein M9898_11325 [Chitinophagaceae bacterium]|nr:hypothetical protein [Chitinophagaceae bacterium]